MDVTLTPELERLIHDKVASGLYTSEDEVIREALRLLKDRDELRVLAVEDLRREVQKGLDQLACATASRPQLGRSATEAICRSSASRPFTVCATSSSLCTGTEQRSATVTRCWTS